MANDTLREGRWKVEDVTKFQFEGSTVGGVKNSSHLLAVFSDLVPSQQQTGGEASPSPNTDMAGSPWQSWGGGQALGRPSRASALWEVLSFLGRNPWSLGGRPLKPWGLPTVHGAVPKLLSPSVSGARMRSGSARQRLGCTRLRVIYCNFMSMKSFHTKSIFSLGEIWYSFL